MSNTGPLETTKGFLTDQMRSYLSDPEGFEAEHGKETVTDVRNRIRNARTAAIEQLQFLDEYTDLWVRKQPRAAAFPSSEPHVDPVPLHEPLPDDHAIDFAIHADTIQALKGIQQELSRFTVDKIVDQLESKQIPDEFDSRLSYREYLQERRQDFRTRYDSEKLPTHEVFRGNDFLTVDDIIRLSLLLTPPSETIEDLERERLSMFPGIHQEKRYEMLKTLTDALDRSYLRRRR